MMERLLRSVQGVPALQSIIDELATPVFVKDREHRWILVNRALCDLIGRSASDLIGKSDFDVFPPDQARVFWDNDDLVFASGEANENEEEITGQDGQVRIIVTRKRRIELDGAPLLVAVITDITAFREAEAHSRYLAYHDILSGLANRALLSERMEAALAVARRTAQRCSFLYIDLDRFKQVNDAYGHPAGDELIQEFAKRLQALVRSTDTVARLGGDEFAVFLCEVPTREALGNLCRRILDAAKAPFDVAGTTVHIDTSIGVVPDLTPEMTPAEILRQADVALYSAKSGGRGRYRFYSESMDEGRRSRMLIETELRLALHKGKGIEVHYQPLYCGDTVTGVEALVRWNHPRLGLLSPARFLPIAEETGLIVPLGDLVLESGCRALRNWPGITLAVNLSAIQLRDPNLATRILRCIRKHGLEPERLELEITETTVISADTSTLACLRKLRAAGVKVALDDFGTGYSSLSHLQNLQVDRIKIDRTFVSHIGEVSDSSPIVQAVVHIGRMLGLKVTAEGVETEGQRRFLLDAGCTHLQGYLMSPPVPEDQIAELLGSLPNEKRSSASSKDAA